MSIRHRMPRRSGAAAPLSQPRSRWAGIVARTPRSARLFVVFFGEAGQSGFHLILNIALLRLLSAEGYGVFAVTFILASVGITYMQALVGTPIGVILPRHRRAGAMVWQATFSCASAALALVTAVMIFASVSLWLERPEFAPAAALFAAAWFLRGFARASLFANGSLWRAGLSDAAFVTSGLVLGTLAILFSPLDPLLDAFVVLFISHVVGIVAAVAGTRFKIAFRMRLLVRYARLWPSLAWSVGGVTSANLQAQGQMLLVAAIAGPAAYAPIAASMIVFAPLRTLGAALFNLLQPAFASALSIGDDRKIRKLLFGGGAMIAVSGLLLGAATYVFFRPIEEFLLKPQFAGEPIALLMVLAWLIVTLAQLYAAPRALMLGAHAFKLVALINLVSAAFGLASVATLLIVMGTAWSLLGVVFSELITLVSLWIAAWILLRRLGREPLSRKVGTHNVA